MELKEIVKNIVSCNRIGRVRYIYDYLNSLNLSPVFFQYADRLWNIEYRKDSTDSKGDLVVFAHHDISLKTREGANDNTSSVAVLLKLSQMVAGLEFPYNLRFVFNDNEELLGAMNPAVSLEEMKKIMINVGSFRYLKEYPDRDKIKHVLILELCGIGDTIYIAEKSGNVITDVVLNQKLLDIAKRRQQKAVSIPIPSTDMISIKAFGLSGTVIGAIPFYQAKNCGVLEKENFIPSVWKNIHSDKDNLFALSNKALEMVCQYLFQVLKEL